MERQSILFKVVLAIVFAFLIYKVSTVNPSTGKIIYKHVDGPYHESAEDGKVTNVDRMLDTICKAVNDNASDVIACEVNVILKGRNYDFSGKYRVMDGTSGIYYGKMKALCEGYLIGCYSVEELTFLDL